MSPPGVYTHQHFWWRAATKPANNNCNLTQLLCYIRLVFRELVFPAKHTDLSCCCWGASELGSRHTPGVCRLLENDRQYSKNIITLSMGTVFGLMFSSSLYSRKVGKWNIDRNILDIIKKTCLIVQICFDQELVEGDPATSLWRFCTLLPFSLKEIIRNATVHPNPPRTKA